MKDIMRMIDKSAKGNVGQYNDRWQLTTISQENDMRKIKVQIGQWGNTMTDTILRGNDMRKVE